MDKEHVVEFLWRDFDHQMSIKDSWLKQKSFCKYTWEVIAYIVITGKACLGPKIWLEIPNQGTGGNNIILSIWYNEAIKWKEIKSQQQHLSSPTAEEACYTSNTSSN